MGTVRVRFNLEIEEDGFPPISVELLHARIVDGDTVEIDNTPFFAKSVAAGDIVACSRTGSEGVLQFERVVTESGNKAISIIFVDDDCKEDVYQHLRSSGHYCEYGEFADFNMLAVSIAKDADYSTLKAYLDGKEANNSISYAELCL